MLSEVSRDGSERNVPKTHGPSGPAVARGGWIELVFEGDAGLVARIADALSATGALAVTLREEPGEEPVYEPAPGAEPIWHRTQVCGLFEARVDVLAVLRRLRAEIAPRELPGHRVEQLPDRDWTREWMRHCQPLQFGERLLVCPRTATAGQLPSTATVRVELDPGLAFGTGSHPSTALCLEWLARTTLTGQSLIDYGCGSGILAIAALKLGAREAWAIDHDPQALHATRENAAANAVAGRLHVLPPEDRRPLRADVLIGNILANPLIALAPRLAELVRPGGRLVLSGILETQQEAVRAAFATAFTFGPAATRAGWVRLDGRRAHCA